jgi:hypothetical protein
VYLGSAFLQFFSEPGTEQVALKMKAELSLSPSTRKQFGPEARLWEVWLFISMCGRCGILGSIWLKKPNPQPIPQNALRSAILRYV